MLPGAREALPEELRRRLGAEDQLVSVERAVLTEGAGAGEPVLVVRNPGGVSFEVLLDRAMDIGWADAAGTPLAWRSPRGRAAATRYEPTGRGWARTFGGGLMATCGLAATGAPSTVGGTEHPLHGRIGHTPAEDVRWELTGAEEELVLEISGEIVEAGLGTPTMRLRRVLRAWCGRPRIEVHDVVLNDSHGEAGHMFRHHLNLGYPLVTDGVVLRTGARPAGMRDEPGVPDLDGTRLEVAEGVVGEQVLYGRVHGDDAWVTLEGPTGRLAVAWDPGTFPFLVLWRDASPGVNVLGVEPSTSRDGGRARAEEDGEVVVLAPQESRAYRTTIEWHPA